MKKFTVLLLVPDYLAQTYGQDTFFTCVPATGPKQAIAQDPVRSRRETRRGRPDDFFLLCVIEGEHRNIKDEV